MTQRLLFMDGETFYSDEYSLSLMTPAEYILDPRWELQLMAVREGSAAPYVVEGPDFPAWVRDAKPSAPNTATVTWNALFDAPYMAWRYGYNPGTLIDAMGMARAIVGHEVKNLRLATVADHMRIGRKGDTVSRVKGMHREDIKRAGLWGDFCDYAIQDVNLTRGIFYILQPHFPRAEFKFMDLVLRCCVEPRFVANKRLLYEHYVATRNAKNDLIASAKIQGLQGPDQYSGPPPPEGDASIEWQKAQLRSDAKFAAQLESRGVTIQYKTTKKGNTKPAFAKTDQFMIELEDHPDPDVQALVAARLGLKSTLEETRSKRLLSIAILKWPADIVQGPDGPSDGKSAYLPIPLRYAGAHTHRLSGDWKLNMQNLPRGGKLRQALCAKSGEEVIVADLKQIECRVNAWFCGQTDLLDVFRMPGGDPYSDLATDIFGRKINRKLPTDTVEGFIGKTGVLGLGFGCGEGRFYDMVRGDSHKLGVDLKGMWTPELASKSVATFRRKNPRIQAMWNRLSGVIRQFWSVPGSACVAVGPVIIGYGYVQLPNGMFMRYNNPRRGEPDANGRERFIYEYGKSIHPMNGPTLLENIIQALARIIASNAAIRLSYRGLQFAHQEHDALAWLVSKERVDTALEIIRTEMRKPPVWAPSLPVDIDIGHGPNYGAAKS